MDLFTLVDFAAYSWLDYGILSIAAAGGAGQTASTPW
jgi:hypothetical protein